MLLFNTDIVLFEKYLVNDCDTLDAFLDKYRKASRYKLRDGNDWGKDYSQKIRQSHIDELKKYGITTIAPYESNTGITVAYNGKI